MGKRVDITGERFGRLTAISFNYRDKHRHSHWLCKCDCGNEHVVELGALRSGKANSCGCLQKELVAIRTIKHGMSKTKTYKSWVYMVQRCTNKRNEYFNDYGGRGITVCDEWHRFENFYRDMGEKPEGMTLDRKDVNGDYCKNNCRWATDEEQSNNRRNNHLITFNHKTLSLSQWSSVVHIASRTLERRINLLGWSIKEALMTPVGGRR